MQQRFQGVYNPNDLFNNNNQAAAVQRSSALQLLIWWCSTKSYASLRILLILALIVICCWTMLRPRGRRVLPDEQTSSTEWGAAFHAKTRRLLE